MPISRQGTILGAAALFNAVGGTPQAPHMRARRSLSRQRARYRRYNGSRSIRI